jgi:hypothetical protein
MNTVDEIELLKNNIIEQAKYYLHEFGGFYPFGAAINNLNELKPVSVYMNTEDPSSNDVIHKLEEGMKALANKKYYIATAIGSDVIVNLPGFKEKIDAIQIRICGIGFESKDYFIPYIKEESSGYKYLNLHEENGTLKIFK